MMHETAPTDRSARIRTFAHASLTGRVACIALCAVLVACHEAAPDGAPARNEGESKESAGVTLTPQQIEKLGLVTQAARSIDYADETAGYGVVVSHDTIAQAAAELATAQANERLSRSALRRFGALAGTPGAVSADVEETAAQKVEVDAAASTLTLQRLSATLGMKPPWKYGDKDATLRQLANGKIKLLRATFPLGALSGGIPGSLRAARLGAEKPGTSWRMKELWDAPADANFPGRSVFALLRNSDAGEGERLQVWAPVGATTSGVEVPAAAVVMSEGKYWCYVERKPGTFQRTEVDTSKPTPAGYFVTAGFAAGAEVVTSAAGQLLAAESGSSADPDGP